MNYIEQVLQHIRFKPDRAAIRQELEEHIEDMLSFAPPMEDGEAESYVWEQMGDPEVVGQALDKEHHVVLGWIWRVAQRICLVTVVCLFITIGFFVGNIAREMILEGSGYKNRAGEPIATIQVNESSQMDNIIFQIDEVVMYPNGAIELRYQYRYDYFARGAKWTFCFANQLFDEKGNCIGMGSQSRRRAGFTTYCQHLWEKDDIDTQTIMIHYSSYGREFYAEIPLDWEVD